MKENFRDFETLNAKWAYLLRHIIKADVDGSVSFLLELFADNCGGDGVSGEAGTLQVVTPFVARLLWDFFFLVILVSICHLNGISLVFEFSRINVRISLFFF